MEAFYREFAKLPRQGPGDPVSTRRAFMAVRGLPPTPRILDVGCGTGAQTLELARISGGRVDAIDTCKLFLDELMRRAATAGLAERITTHDMSMDALDFPARSFDLIWSEAAIYSIGFERGLREWAPFLVDGGWLAASEAVWLSDDPPTEAREFWDAEYPAMSDIEDNRRIAESAGYVVVEAWPLPSSSWSDEYYSPLIDLMNVLQRKSGVDADVLSGINATRREIDIFQRYSDHFGYAFFVMRKE